MIPLFFLSVKPRKLRKLPQGFAQPSRLKSTQIYSKSISSVSPPKGHLESGSFAYSTPQDSLINPQYSLIESQSFFTRREPVHISQTDIRTLFQVRVYCIIYKILQASGEKLKACLIKTISHQKPRKAKFSNMYISFSVSPYCTDTFIYPYFEKFKSVCYTFTYNDSVFRWFVSKGNKIKIIKIFENLMCKKICHLCLSGYL